MKYTSVKVLKPVPGYEPDTYELVQISKSGQNWFGLGDIKDNEYIGISVDYMRHFPDFFRLISEPEFKVGGYAKAIRKYNEAGGLLEEGRIYHIQDVFERGISIQMDCGLGAWGKSCFTPSTEEEYLKQEEGKKPWRPKNDEVYFIIASDGSIDHTRYNPKWESDSLRIEIGNRFRTRESAEYFLEHFWKPLFAKYSEVYSTLPEEMK